MAALPYVKLYPGDYFADTRHLTCLQHGAYLQLILSYWSRGGPLPNDDKILARMVGLGPREWARIKPVIMPFFVVDAQQIVNNRLERELHSAESKSLNNKRYGNANATRSKRERTTHHSHSHSQLEGEVPSNVSDKESDTTRARAPAGVGDDEVEVAPEQHFKAAFENWWSEYPNKTGKGAAALKYDLAFTRLGGAKIGVAKVHAVLLARLVAQRVVWRHKGVEGRYIPHAATWLNQARYEDDAVKAMAEKLANPLPEPEPPELSPPTPKPEKRALAPAIKGWSPEDDEPVS